MRWLDEVRARVEAVVGDENRQRHSECRYETAPVTEAELEFIDHAHDVQRALALLDECAEALRAVPVGPGAGVHVSGCASLAHRPPDPRPVCDCHVAKIRAALARLDAEEE